MKAKNPSLTFKALFWNEKAVDKKLFLFYLIFGFLLGAGLFIKNAISWNNEYLTQCFIITGIYTAFAFWYKIPMTDKHTPSVFHFFGLFFYMWAVFKPYVPWWGNALVAIVFFVFTSLADADTPDIDTRDSTLGSARFTDSIPDNHKSHPGCSFCLGRDWSQDKKTVDYFYQLGHILTCAPSGAGKGVSVVIPNLLEYLGSTFCVDIKGENFAVTHRHRKEVSEIVLIDPFRVTDGAVSSINPFSWLDAFPDDVTADSKMIADSLIVNSGESENDFWIDSARDLVRGLICYINQYKNLGIETERSLGELRRLITLPKDALNGVFQSMQTCGNRVAERCGNTFITMDEKTRSGIISTAQQQTSFLDDERIETALSGNGFDISRFKHSPTSIYLVMPPERLADNFRIIRLIISLLITSVTRIPEKPLYPALFLFDEFAQLGRMGIIEDTLSLIRGYGAYYWFIIQDLSQLKAVYKKWQTFFANTSKQFFSTNDYDTAKYVSDMLGMKTISFTTSGESASRSNSESGSDSRSSSDSSSTHLQARSLLTPDEVMNLSKDKEIVFVAGERPYLITKLDYLNDGSYAGLFDENPMHRAVSFRS